VDDADRQDPSPGQEPEGKMDEINGIDQDTIEIAERLGRNVALLLADYAEASRLFFKRVHSLHARILADITQISDRLSKEEELRAAHFAAGLSAGTA
jgi:hypothetical protein